MRPKLVADNELHLNVPVRTLILLILNATHLLGIAKRAMPNTPFAQDCDKAINDLMTSFSIDRAAIERNWPTKVEKDEV
jgi:hypothetical protein